MPLFGSRIRKEVRKELRKEIASLVKEGLQLQFSAFEYGLNESEVKVLLGISGVEGISVSEEDKERVKKQARAQGMSDGQIAEFDTHIEKYNNLKSRVLTPRSGKSSPGIMTQEELTTYAEKVEAEEVDKLNKVQAEVAKIEAESVARKTAKYKRQARQTQQEAMHQAVPLLNHDGEGVEEASVVEKSKKSKPAKKGKGYGQLHNEEQLTDAVSEPVSPSALSRANSRSSLLA